MNHHKITVGLMAAWLVAPLVSAAPATPPIKPITHQILWMMKRVGAPVVSPDGKWVVYSVLEPSYEADKAVSDLWLVSTDGLKPPRRITDTTAPEDDVAWSLDSASIAFNVNYSWSSWDYPYSSPGGPPYSLETVAASSVLENDGIQPNSVTWKPMPTNDLIGALRSHLVDAILVTEPQIFQAEIQLGARSVLDACSGETVNLPLDGYFAQASYAKQHQGALAAFHAALLRAQTSANQPAPLNAALAHYAGMSRQTAALITVGVYPTSLKVGSLQRVADLMSFYGALPRPLDVSSMIFP